MVKKTRTPGHSRIWPYSDAKEPKNTHFWISAYEEIESGAPTPHFGVKGKSVLSELNVDPSVQNAVDFMHNSYEGVLDRILGSLFGKLFQVFLCTEHKPEPQSTEQNMFKKTFCKSAR